MDRTTRCVWRWAGAFVSIGLLGLAVTARAAVPPRGSEAPYFALDSVAGQHYDLAQFQGHPIVLLFGDLRHEGANRASREVLRILKDTRFRDAEIAPVFVTAERSSPEDMAKTIADGTFPDIVLHDPERQAFGGYEILVVPSIVVVDREGIVIHAMPGFLPRFEELLTQSLLVATGQMTEAAFEASLGVADSAAPATDPNTIKAERLTHLGEQLLGHKMEDMAEARFREAVQLAPGYAPARLALGDLYRARGEPDLAEAQLRALLDANPDSLEGRLALARVQIDQGGTALDEAEKTIREVLNTHPTSAQGHYELGLILEARGDHRKAAASYRKAAELLLDQ